MKYSCDRHVEDDRNADEVQLARYWKLIEREDKRRADTANSARGTEEGGCALLLGDGRETSGPKSLLQRMRCSKGSIPAHNEPELSSPHAMVRPGGVVV